jgi:hypothetical protein
MSKSLSYIARIQQSQLEKDASAASFQAEEANLQLQSDLNATKKELSVANRAVETAKGANPFSSKNVIDAQIKVEGLTEGVKRLEKLQSELFGA